MQNGLGDIGGDVLAVLMGNQGQKHIERRSTAGTGEAVAIDFEQSAGRLDVREFFAKAGQVLPVESAAVAIEDAGLGQNMGAGADRADVNAAARGFRSTRRMTMPPAMKARATGTAWNR